MTDNTREELYEDDKGRWFLYIPGPKITQTGEHYDSSNIKLPRQFGKALQRYFQSEINRSNEQLLDELLDDPGAIHWMWKKDGTQDMVGGVPIDVLRAKRKEIKEKQ